MVWATVIASSSWLLTLPASTSPIARAWLNVRSRTLLWTFQLISAMPTERQIRTIKALPKVNLALSESLFSMKNPQTVIGMRMESFWTNAFYRYHFRRRYYPGYTNDT